MTKEIQMASVRFTKNDMAKYPFLKENTEHIRKLDLKIEDLRQAGRNCRQCETCGSDYKLTVHHIDGNPFDNGLENLQVLCWHCHLLFHEPSEAGVHEELEGTKSDFDNLDNPETRRFHGIVEEDIPTEHDEDFSEEPEESEE